MKWVKKIKSNKVWLNHFQIFKFYSIPILILILKYSRLIYGIAFDIISLQLILTTTKWNKTCSVCFPNKSRGKINKNKWPEFNDFFFLHTNKTQLYNLKQYSTVQYSAVQYSTVQYSTVQYNSKQYSTVQYSTIQNSTVQCSTVQYSTA